MEGSKGGGAGVGSESFLWGNQAWAGLSNSDDSGDGQKGDTSGKGKQGSSSNSQTEEKDQETRMTFSQGELMLLMTNENINGAAGDDQVKKEGGSSGGGAGESDHEMHIFTERERRKKMRNMFNNLHSLLPHLPSKADKSTIVDEATNYIKALQQTLHYLQKQKLEMLQEATAATSVFDPSSSTALQNLAGADWREAFLVDHQGSSNILTLTETKPPNNELRHPIIFQTWTSSNVVLNICGQEAQISICSLKKPRLFTAICHVLEKHNIEMLSAHVSTNCYSTMIMIQARVNGASDELPGMLMAEEKFKLAAGEMVYWVSA